MGVGGGAKLQITPLHFRDMSGSSSGGLRNDDSKVEVIFLVAI